MGVPKAIWTDSPEHPILDLTIDLSDHILFWTYNACVYEYHILETGPPESIWCFDNHNEYPHHDRDFNPSLLRYYNDKVIMYLSDRDEFLTLDEHTHYEEYYTSSFTITFDELFRNNIKDFVFRHFTIQPGNMTYLFTLNSYFLSLSLSLSLSLFFLFLFLSIYIYLYIYIYLSTCISLSPFQDTHWCTRTNGDCESAAETLCLITDHYDRVCQCPPTEFIQVQYDEEREVCRYNCIGQ